MVDAWPGGQLTGWQFALLSEGAPPAAQDPGGQGVQPSATDPAAAPPRAVAFRTVPAGHSWVAQPAAPPAEKVRAAQGWHPSVPLTAPEALVAEEPRGQLIGEHGAAPPALKEPAGQGEQSVGASDAAVDAAPGAHADTPHWRDPGALKLPSGHTAQGRSPPALKRPAEHWAHPSVGDDAPTSTTAPLGAGE
jgi:hypothetical protein